MKNLVSGAGPCPLKVGSGDNQHCPVNSPVEGKEPPEKRLERGGGGLFSQLT